MNDNSKSASIATSEELSQLASLEAELAVFNEQQDSLTPGLVERKLTAAQQRYSQNPTQETYAAMESAAIRVGFLERHIFPPAMLAAVSAVRERIINERMAPIVCAILERALRSAQQRLEEVVAEESERSRGLSTAKSRVHSSTIDAFQAPVLELKNLLTAANGGRALVMLANRTHGHPEISSTPRVNSHSVIRALHYIRSRSCESNNGIVPLSSVAAS